MFPKKKNAGMSNKRIFHLEIKIFYLNDLGLDPNFYSHRKVQSKFEKFKSWIIS
jgi:hypothetical protein